MGLKRIAKHFKVVHSKHRIGLPEVLHQHIHEFVTHTHKKYILDIPTQLAESVVCLEH